MLQSQEVQDPGQLHEGRLALTEALQKLGEQQRPTGLFHPCGSFAVSSACSGCPSMYVKGCVLSLWRFHSSHIYP